MSEEFDQAVNTLTTDLDDRLENIEAVKGKNFAEAVQLAVNIHTIMQVAVSDIPYEFRVKMIFALCSKHVVNMANSLGLTTEKDFKEMADIAKSIADQIRTETKRLQPLFDKEIGLDP